VFNIGGAEFLVILLVALLVLGPNKLPQAARQVGHFLGEFRRIADGFQQELKTAMDVDDTPVKMAPKAPPAQKAKSPGGPTDQTVIDADSAEVTGDDPAPDPDVVLGASGIDEPVEEPDGSTEA
jgi:sec-independent protein translocase protein TatB